MNINATHHTTPRKDNKLSKISTTYFVKSPVASELDYTEQTSWLLFLKFLDGQEQDKAMEAELEGFD